jgi:hypothetical protein
MRQTGGRACRLRTQIAQRAFPKGGSVDKSLSYQARRALLHQAVPQYRQASLSQKRTLLDAFVAATGYRRTFSIVPKANWCAAETSALICLWGRRACRAVWSWRPDRAGTQKSRVGVTRAGIVYELFFTKLPRASVHRLRCRRGVSASRRITALHLPMRMSN